MRFSITLAAIALGFASPALSEEPSGDYLIVISGEDSVVTLARGSREACEAVDGGEVCATTTSYTAAANLVVGNGSLTLTGSLQGALRIGWGCKMRGSTQNPRIHCSLLSAAGELTDGVSTIPVDGVGKANCRLDPANALFGCAARVRLCAIVNNRPVSCARLPFFLPLGAEKAPPMHLALHLQTDTAGRITGKAEFLVDVGETPGLGGAGEVWFEVRKGRYNARSGRSTLSFRWARGDDGNKLVLRNVVFEAGTATSGEVRFNVAGQKGRYTTSPSFTPASE